MYDPAPADKSGAFSPIKQYVSPSPTIKARPVMYQSDGQGRDSYITTTSGGLYPNSGHRLEFRDAFKKSLRNWDLMVSQPKQRGSPKPARGKSMLDGN
eukprot:CAMPEP_0176370820 /NCGR_PEP_ID=MMETSP0126-20121128/24269_1 /TAXON_ID=141414 ORGANISM="Strombidinopsis acuminatum, Strain SPMC142" /NCGR_SAMPLE_ID=MMETSP0126 /ASSEMBLY_ACC=CAM_ASM_000229 /LENGTH=97 /DNA_ID=CAMNT_0017730037 /DNA_START=194 /DNA_END=487 /DNA_ORIENTATION=-